MFGGLEIKGSSSKPAANGDENKAAAAAPAPAAGSSFSFLTGAATPAPAATSNDAGSAFSFMGGGSSEKPVTEPVQEKKEASSVSSAFSFLTQPAEDVGKKEKEPSPEKAAPSSTFNFLSATAAPVPASAAAPESATSATTGFSFMSSQADPPSSNDKASSTTSSDPPAEKESKPPSSAGASDLLSTTNPHHPTGSGVVFGGAISVASKKPINRRRRTQKIGAGANASAAPSMTMRPDSIGASSMPPPSAVQPVSPEKPSSPAQSLGGSFVAPSIETVPRQSPAPVPDYTTGSTADAALEAARRAEDFMKEKMKSKFSAPPTPPSYSRTADPTSPQDEDYAEAKAAALEAEAKIMATKKPAPAHGGFRMGGLFKKGWGADRNSSWSSNSGKVIPEPPSTPQQESFTMPAEETAMERIQREQEEIAKSVAERSLAMQRQQEEEQPKMEVPVVEPRPQPPPPPPSPPKQKSPKQLMQEMMEDFSLNASRAMDRVAHLKQQRQSLLEERTAADKKLLLATQQISQAESQQTLAVEEEEFDLADRLAAVMEKWEREKVELNRILDNIGRALTHLNEQRNDVVGAVAACFGEFQTKLEEFQQEQESTERKDDTKAMQRFTATSKQLSAEHERLMNDLKHIERDEGLVAEERNELDNSIAEQTASVEKERLDACEKLQIVQDEIEELRERLAAREAVANQLQMEVGEHDAAIARVKLSFSRQTTRVERKEISVKENRTEWKTEHSRYESEKEAHDEEVKAHSEALLTHDQLMESLKTEISLAETFEKIIAKEVVFESGAVKAVDENKESDDDELSRLQTKVVEGEAAVVEANHVLKAAEAVLECLDVEHKSLIARIPMLESQKKAAAGRRDFKAAGKANKEIKDATSRLKDCEEELTGEATSRVKAAKEELEQLEADLECKRSVMNEKEKEQGVAAMGELAKKIRHLISTKKKVCSGASENSVRAVGAVVLNGQIKALQKEGEMYGNKFGGWEEIMDDIYKEEDDDSRPAKGEDRSKESEREPSEAIKEAGGDAAEAGRVDDRNDAELSKAKIAKFKELTQRLKDAEESLEAAVEREDYDEAADLDVVFQQIQTDLEELGLTDAEMDEAIIEAESGDVLGKEKVETDDVVGDEIETIDSGESAPKTSGSDDLDSDEENGSEDDQDETEPDEKPLSQNGDIENPAAEGVMAKQQKGDIEGNDQQEAELSEEEADEEGADEGDTMECDTGDVEEAEGEENEQQEAEQPGEDESEQSEAVSGTTESLDEDDVDESPKVNGNTHEEVEPADDERSSPGETE